MTLAAKILWLALSMEWTRGIQHLERLWMRFARFFEHLGNDAYAGEATLFTELWPGLKRLWIDGTAFLMNAWTDFVSFLARAWEFIKSGAQKAWNYVRSIFDSSIDLEVSNRLIDQEPDAAIARINQEQQRERATQASRGERADVLKQVDLRRIGKRNLARRAEID